MGDPTKWLADLASAVRDGRRVGGRTAVVAAHPDDETLWVGGCLSACEDLLLIHLTDGAPKEMADARRAGFTSRQAYAEARTHELDAALEALGLRGSPRRYGFADQETASQLPAIARRLARDLDGCAAVITHTYEGGHPDHDSAALAVALACARIEASGRRGPLRLEFAGYHEREGRMVSGEFWAEDGDARMAIELPEAAWRAKQAAAACHASQARVIAGHLSRIERLRPAPAYDFTAPPPPGRCLYDGFGWAMTGELWRRQALKALKFLAETAPAWA